MIIDSSALLALLLDEPRTAELLAAIAPAPDRVVSAPNYVETAIVLVARFGSPARERLDRLLVELDIEVVPFTREQADLAIRAYQQYGKGSGHRLN